MTLLQKLKSLLGIADSGSEPGRDRDVGITVESERDESADSVDEAVEEPSTGEPTADAAVDEGEAEPSDTDETAESAAAETSASSSTNAMTETPDEPEEAAEPGEATGPSEADAAPTTEKTEEPSTDEPGTDELGTDESVDVIKGIGPAYADRLADAGVETVADLATADAEELAEGTDISAKRIQGWIDRAEVR